MGGGVPRHVENLANWTNKTNTTRNFAIGLIEKVLITGGKLFSPEWKKSRLGLDRVELARIIADNDVKIGRNPINPPALVLVISLFFFNNDIKRYFLHAYCVQTVNFWLK